MIDTERYIDFFEREYLNSYIRGGGATVKFCTLSDNAGSAVDDISRSAIKNGFQVVLVDAAEVKAHMIEQVFFAIARQIDWRTLAVRTARLAAAEAGYPVPNDSENLSVAALAFHYATDEKELKRDINQQLQRQIFSGYSMVQEFRIAMLRLCQYELETGQVSDSELDSINAWLKGTLRQVSLLKSVRIFRKIARHNARQMLFSLSHWLVLNGYSGLMVILDIRPFSKVRRNTDENSAELIYSRIAVIDAYESLRQLVDNTDEASNLAFVVLTAPEFLTDPSRGAAAYQALRLRIFDEVRDRRLDNPYSALVRLGPVDGSTNLATAGQSWLEV